MKQLLFFILILSYSYGEFEKSKNIVIDTNTNLMWQDNVEVIYEENISMAKVYCDSLVLNGYIDWRMATIKELQTLIDQNGEHYSLEKGFEYFEKNRYWSNTPSVINDSLYWYVDFGTGKVNLQKNIMRYHVRCVRELP